MAAERKISSSSLHEVFDGSLVGITVHRGFDILYANDRIAHLLKYKNCEDFIAAGDLSTHIPKRRQRQIAERWRKIQNGDEQPERNRVSNYTTDGDEIWLDVSDERIIWEDGEPAILSTIYDATLAVRANESLLSSLRHLEISLDSILEFIPLGIAIFSDVGVPKTVNSTMRLLFQASPRQNDYVPKVMQELVTSIVNSDEHELTVKGVKTRVDKVVDLIARRMADDAIMLCAADVSEWQDTQDKLKTLAERDVLTQLLNRRGFSDTVKPILRQAVEKNEPFAVLVADIDFFKDINDTYGHATGDETLIAFSKRISSALRSQDIVGRVGGEEFAIFLPKISATRAEAIAQRLRKKIEKTPINVYGTSINLTASFGLKIWEGGSEPRLRDLLQDADTALYRAKDTGRNRVSIA